jgi:hypothetical protein
MPHVAGTLVPLGSIEGMQPGSMVPPSPPEPPVDEEVVVAVVLEPPPPSGVHV